MVDRVSSQVLYAVTGIVLARVLSPADFGLVGAILIFQAFASLLVDSGFSHALLQRKSPTRLDYSTILWFNMSVSLILYVALFFAAPLIARCFDNDLRLVPLSRTMFLALPINASAIVQTNILMKRIDVRPIAIANTGGLVLAGITGIWLALKGFGAWAIVWQTLILASVKSLTLWIIGRWRPMVNFSLQALRSFFGIGSRMMLTSFLNTLFLNIYSFVIGNRAGMSALGYYTQSDKWSKMGISSLSQILTSSFLPALSATQDSPERFRRIASKMNRFTAYFLFPAMIGLMATARPIFHLLFGTKWDPSIFLFQLLLFRGVFVVLNSLYNNYLLALGRAKSIVRLEIVRDATALAALAITLPYITLSTPSDPVAGLGILLWGQVFATITAWGCSLAVLLRHTHTGLMAHLRDLIPYFAITGVIIPVINLAGNCFDAPAVRLSVEILLGVSLYTGINHLLGSTIQREVFDYIKGKSARNC